MEKIDKEEFELMKSNCFWAGRLLDLPKEKSWEIADEIVAAIQYAESQVKNHGVLHHVSQQRELLLDLICEIKKASLAIPMSNEKEIRLRSIIKSIYSG